MKLGDVISFRRDLLFQGAVQLGWLERKKSLANKAAAHFIFHGPNYHGARGDDFTGSNVRLVDTASFTKEITDRLVGTNTGEPFTIGIAGYGTGKSHLGLTLSTLFSNPSAKIAKKILNNLSLADPEIGKYVANSIDTLQGKPFLVIALNGMEDFDLGSELSRQLLSVLKSHSIDTSILENLRPRFKYAGNFARSFHSSLETEFKEKFGPEYDLNKIIYELHTQDEQTFAKVNEIYTRKMGSPISAAGQESLQDFIRVVSKQYCGTGKPFAGLLIIFDEFGRYIEFAVQKPHIAGPAALQQLFEAVQENVDNVFLLAFVQTELKAYASRVMPQRREEIDRYLTRFDTVPKVRLSANLETVIANLLEKKDYAIINNQLSTLQLGKIHSLMLKWFPELQNHSLWFNETSFSKVIGEGCWPLHPISTWILYKLSAIGQSLQQRSALSLLAEVMDYFSSKEIMAGQVIKPTDLLTGSLLNEFASSERIGSQRTITGSYQVVLEKYRHELSPREKTILKAILLQQKIAIKVTSKDDYIAAVSLFTGMHVTETSGGLGLLEREYGILEWNNILNQYEIVADAIPRGVFLANLESKTKEIDLDSRGQIFTSNIKQWLDLEDYKTDFGEKSGISTKEWNYDTLFADVDLIGNQIEFALRAWIDAINADTNKGQLIYCYVGPDSDVDLVRKMAMETIKSKMKELDQDIKSGAPLAIMFCDDYEGELGVHLAEHWILERGFSEEERARYANFIEEEKRNTKEKLEHLFFKTQEKQNPIFAAPFAIKQQRPRLMLEELFNMVYPNRIPFPFDGFYTIRGNAATDCQTFCKELLIGNLDREWLQARNQRERNRGYSVLDNSWGIFDNSGSVRLLPTNPKVRHLLEVLNSMVDKQTDGSGICLGKILRKWMAPPFGCNLASGGLLLSLYIGRRQHQFELLYDNRPAKIEQWLGLAMPKNFFDLSILDKTFLIKLSEDRVSAWEKLLEKWELEPTYVGMVNYYSKARKLDSTTSIPLQLSDKYELLRFQTKRAAAEIKNLDDLLADALDKIENGNRKKDISLLSWGAAILAEQLTKMKDYGSSWTYDQLEEVESYYTSTYDKIKQLFPEWLPQQKETDIERLGKFMHHMKINVGGNFRTIGLTEEINLLEAHVEEVKKNVHRLAEIKSSTEEANRLINNKIVSASSTMLDLKNWCESGEKIKNNLMLARQQVSLGRSEIESVTGKINKFLATCNKQMQLHLSGAGNIYNHRPINDLATLKEWKTDAIKFIGIFAGYERDIQDFRQVVKQLELLENQYIRLANNDLTDADLTKLLEDCQRELTDSFANDTPPLDEELIYKDMMKSIRYQRNQLASNWLNSALSKLDRIDELDAVGVLSVKKYLENMPALLSEKQREGARKGIKKCDRRIEELEVEGLLAQFDAFPRQSKLVFLRRLKKYMEQTAADLLRQIY